MIRLLADGRRLKLEITDPHEPRVTKDVTGFKTVFKKRAPQILEKLLRHANGRRYHTQINNAFALQAMSDYLLAAQCKEPVSESNWQDLVINLYQFVLSRRDSNQRLRSRESVWAWLVPLLCLLRDQEDVIPLGVEVPRIPDRLSSIDLVRYHAELLGQAPPQPVDSDVDKLLVNVSLARTDAEYLEEVRDQLIHRKKVLEGCLIEWLDQVKAHFDYGCRIVKGVHWPSLKKRLDAGAYMHGRGKGAGRGKYHIANGSRDQGLGHLLTILRYEYDSRYNPMCFEKGGRVPTRQGIKVPLTAPSAVSPSVTKTQRLNWMLGNLFRVDVAVCMALLIMRNPSFTPASLLRARLVDKNGKPYLELADGSLTFRIEKARSKAMKKSALDDLSIQVIQMVLNMTARARASLKKRGSPRANLLFPAVGPRGAPTSSLTGITKSLSSEKESVLFLHHFPALTQAGLTKGSINFKKIRATEGVIEWFRTGSIAAMARKLGNTNNVVLTNYLPRALLIAWNTRLIRRFQNLWLVAAAAKETFLLEVTDFHTLEDLHAFLLDMLLHHAANSSPLAAVIHRDFSHLLPQETTAPASSRNASLAIAVSANALAALYLYQEAALIAGVPREVMAQRDVVTGTCPSQFLNLAELMRHQLPNARDPNHRRAHEEALQLLPRWRERIKWHQLIARKAEALG